MNGGYRGEIKVAPTITSGSKAALRLTLQLLHPLKVARDGVDL